MTIPRKGQHIYQVDHLPAAAVGGAPLDPHSQQMVSGFYRRRCRARPHATRMPGLAGKMNPKPDHGETSYKGSGRLAGRKALITGGDSGMGRAAAIAYAHEGADVAINYLPAEESDAREVIQHYCTKTRGLR